MSNTPETQEAFERWQQGKINIFDEMARLERERNNLQDQRDFCMGEIERLREERGTAREALRFIAEWVIRTHKTEYGDIQCNGKWCAEQAKEALR